MISAGLGPPEMAMPILLMLCLWFAAPGQHAQTVNASAGHRSAQGAKASSRRRDFKHDGVMPERRDDLHADRPTIRMGFARAR